MNDCVLWDGGLNRQNGYGVLRWGKQIALAHRFSWAFANGQFGAYPPKHVVIRHTCNTPSCVNPEHLRAGTQSENILDCVKAGRYNRPSGKAHWTKRKP